MVTVKSSRTGRVYEVRSQLYGTSNLVHRLYFGGIFLASTGAQGLNVPSHSWEDAIAIADERSIKLGIEITE